MKILHINGTSEGGTFNVIYDLHKALLKKIPFLKLEKQNLPKIILVTGHRRESFGSGFKNICIG